MNSGEPLTLPLQSLLDHSQWVRRLAHRLVQDPALADDLAQEAVLVALQGRPEPRRWRAYLAGVLRNLVRDRARRDARRHQRERVVARADLAPSTFDLVEELTTHQRVVAGVMELPEKYRQVLLLRYFRDETPTAIAERLGVPVRTVKTRLQRALQRMRKQLGSVYEEDGKSWRQALAIFAGVPASWPNESVWEPAPACTQPRAPTAAAPSSSSGTSWSVTWSLSFLAGIGLLFVVGGGVWWVAGSWSSAGAPGSAVDSAGSAPQPAAVAESPGSVPDRGSPGLADQADLAANRARTDATEVFATPVSLRTVSGRVYGTDGKPVSFALLAFQPDRTDGFSADLGGAATAVTVSDERGRFVLELQNELPGWLTGRSAGWVTVSSGRVVSAAADSSDEVVVVLAAARELVGRIVDAVGQPVVDAHVRYRLPPTWRARIPASFAESEPRFFRARTDASGTFDFGTLPDLHGARVEVAAHGRRQEWAAHTLRSPATLVLADARSPQWLCRGRVVGKDERPLAGAVVGDGVRATITDDKGEFIWPDEEPPASIVVAAADHTVQTVREPWSEGRDRLLHLTLEPGPARIEGCVLREDGSAAANVRVWIEDPIVLDVPRGPPDRDEGSWRSWSAKQDFAAEFPRTAEAVVRSLREPDSEALIGAVRTDAEGRFRLHVASGTRTYSVCALDPVDLAYARVAASSSDEQDSLLTVRVPRASLHGIVLDDRGGPLPGARIRVESRAQRLVDDGGPWLSISHRGACVRSDRDGRFRLPSVPENSCVLVITAKGHRRVQLTPFDGAVSSGSQLRVVLPRARTMRLALRGAGDVIECCVLDAAEEPLELLVETARSLRGSTSLPVVDGCTETFVVAASATTVRLEFADGSHRRIVLPPLAERGGVEIVDSL